MQPKDKSLKIGFVLDDSLDKSDGVQQYILTIGEWLRAEGHDVHYLVGSTKRDDIANIHSLSRNVNVRFNGNRMSMPLPSSRKKLRELLYTQQFDVIHVQMPYSPYMAHRLILECPDKTAIVGTFHIVGDSRIVTSATKVLGKWTKRSLKQFDAVVSVSEAARLYAKQTFRIDTAILPNVVDYQRFHSAQKIAAYQNQRELKILFLGRLVPRKGCLLLLKAIPHLLANKDIPKFTVIICGKGPLLGTLQQYVNKHNLQETVDFVGYVSEQDKPHYYATADIAVFPSNGGESFGIVLLEAMASGNAAVLAGDNVGYHAVLSRNPELLFDPRSVKALVSKLTAYIQSDKKRNMAKAWGATYSKQYDVAKVGPELTQIYYEALRKRLGR